MDWVFWIDTDEKLLNGGGLLKYTRRNMWHGLSIKQHHFSIDAGFKPDQPVRCFRRGPFFRPGTPLDGNVMRFIGQIHEHPELDLNAGPGDVLILPDVDIAHMGYLDERTRRIRFDRNTPLLAADRQKYPGRILQKHFIMRDNILLCQYELEKSGGKITERAKELAREVIDIYRENFLGKSHYANIDSLQYYTSALRVLGEGIDVTFTVNASRDGVGDDLNNGHAVLARFANAEEAKQELSFLVDQKFGPLQQESW